MSNEVAIVIGHDKMRPGAYSLYLGMSEYIYNTEVAQYLACVADVYKRPLAGNYKKQMEQLASQINKKPYKLVVELHFNAFNKKASGCEAVIYKGNSFTAAVGDRFCQLVTKKYATKNRGVKEVSNPNDRGYWFLQKMKAPAIILEPFFGDNEEALKFKNPGALAEIIKQLLCEFQES